MKPLTIWILQTGEPLPIGEGTPRPMRAMNLANALTEAGHYVVLWSSCFHHSDKKFRCNTFETTQINNLLEVRLIPSRGYKKNIGIGRLVDHAFMGINLKRILGSESVLPDVAFIGFPPIETTTVMSHWLYQRNVPFILDIKDQWPDIFISPLQEGYLKSVARFLLQPYFYLANRSIREASGITSITETFLQWGVSKANRVRNEYDSVVPLVPPPENKISQQQLEAATSWWDNLGIFQSGTPCFCFVGSHTPAFDFEPIYTTAKLFSEQEIKCDFIICGDGVTNQQLKNRMDHLPNVYFPGWIDQPKYLILSKYVSGTFAPYKSTSDFMSSVPNKILDSLSLGLPILTSLKGDVQRLVEQHQVGIFYESSSDLFEGMKAFIADSTLQKFMSDNAKSLYETEYSFELIYGSLITRLEKLGQVEED